MTTPHTETHSAGPVAAEADRTPSRCEGRPVILDVRNLSTEFVMKRGTVRAVREVSFTLREGEVLAIVGESGSGKSVAALSAMRLLQAPGRVAAGEVVYRGKDLLRLPGREMRDVRGNHISMIFQEPMTSLNPVFTIEDQLTESIRTHMKLDKKAAGERAIEMLRLVGIPSPEKRVKDYPHQMSGGMRQRVMTAMALSCDPDVLIADEPTTALDVTIQAQILDLMVELQQRTGTSIIMITHDLGVVADMADDVMVMYGGKQVEYSTSDEVFYSPMHPYTWGLLDSLPRHDIDEKGTLLPITGQPPSLIRVPSGCSFHPRCPYAQPVCAAEVPALREATPGHLVACHFAGQEGFERGSARRTEEVA